MTAYLSIFRTVKIYREGDSISTCFSLAMWGLYAMLVMVTYGAITGEKALLLPFFALSLLTFAIVLWAFYLIWKS